MGRNIVIGRTSAECGVRSAESPVVGRFRTEERISKIRSFRIPHSALRSQRGFSLLELMIAMFILIILLSVALPTYQRSIQHARQVVLRENLWQMRRAIDQYTADKGRLPQSIDELVEGKYLREKPVDPITEKTEWEEVMGDDILSPDAEQGLKDVKSLAEGMDGDGMEYKEY